MKKEYIENSVIKFFRRTNVNPRQRIERDNGGQYLENFLREFAYEIRKKAIKESQEKLRFLENE